MFWGKNLNDIGNTVLAGHNYMNNVFFGGLRELEIGDKIELTDKKRNTVTYKIYKIHVIDPNDISIILPQKEGKRELTLITCTNGRADRLIVRAVEEM